ncbi:MAG: Mov34/MPN/PAD-1 family protein [Planctomycetota bacterium]
MAAADATSNPPDPNDPSPAFRWRAGSLSLDRESTGLLADWLQSSHPQEACGLLIAALEGDTWRGHFTRAANEASDPERSFRVPAQHVMHWDREAQRSGRRILGHWHHHPGGEAQPSARDRAELPEGWLGLVLALGPGGLRWACHGTPAETRVSGE